MEHLELWNKVRTVPETAKKAISGGRLNGKTDINPVWRIKTLTEQFGPCGFGWRYEIINKHMETGSKDEIAAFVDINLYVNDPTSGWSQAIPGTGGSMFIELEKAGLHTSDECFKMALTDALSVACKALGIGADVYFEKDASKYDKAPAQPATAAPATPAAPVAKTAPTADKPEDPEAVISNAKFNYLVSLVQDDKQQIIPESQAQLANIYKAHGYQKANQIKNKDYQSIVDDVGTALPFDL